MTPRDRDDPESDAGPGTDTPGPAADTDVEKTDPGASTKRSVAAGSQAAGVAVRRARQRGRREFLLAMIFLLPALFLLGAYVMYPIVFSGWRSFYDKTGQNFVGLENWSDMFSQQGTLTAIKNNAIWVVVAPTLVTALGLVFAVLSERIRWSTAFKVLLFMPMAISSLSAGVIWKIVYESEPQVGVLNAGIQGVTNVFRPPGAYPGATPTDTELLQPRGKSFATTRSFSPGDTAELGLVAILPGVVPAEAEQAAPPQAEPGAIAGVVWLDFTLGGGGEKGVVDNSELGLPGVAVEALDDGRAVAAAETDAQGRFVLADLPQGSYTLELDESAFRQPWGGITWLGAGLITPALIAAYIWIWAGFAVVVIGAGLAAIPRDVLEAARIDGATEWQVFRRVTVPLLMPVVLVVLVTLIINVLKIFDLIFVTAPGSVQDDANVIALQMWRVAFGPANNHGLGSALALFLFVLVLPAMIFNFRRFKAEKT